MRFDLRRASCFVTSLTFFGPASFPAFRVLGAYGYYGLNSIFRSLKLSSLDTQILYELMGLELREGYNGSAAAYPRGVRRL